MNLLVIALSEKDMLLFFLSKSLCQSVYCEPSHISAMFSSWLLSEYNTKYGTS